MQTYKSNLIELAIRYQALQFGQFTLKSGRQSPYFFNAGVFSSGEALAQLGQCYAAALREADLHFDVLFGPAYKGIPLACATAMALSTASQSIPFAYNRKEAKDHGEGGTLVGASLNNQRVIIVDDVITAGTAIQQSIEIIHAAKGRPAGIIVALDRQEKGTGSLSAVQEIQAQYHIPVLAIVSLKDLLLYVQHAPALKTYYPALHIYHTQHGI